MTGSWILHCLFIHFSSSFFFSLMLSAIVMKGEQGAIFVELIQLTHSVFSFYLYLWCTCSQHTQTYIFNQLLWPFSVWTVILGSGFLFNLSLSASASFSYHQAARHFKIQMCALYLKSFLFSLFLRFSFLLKRINAERCPLSPHQT